MDPNANLREQKDLADAIANLSGTPDAEEIIQKGERLAELVAALDAWIRRGGFLPDAWKHA